MTRKSLLGPPRRRVPEAVGGGGVPATNDDGEKKGDPP